MKMHDVGPTLIPSRPQIGSATLKYSETHLFPPCHEVADVFSRRRKLLSDK